MMDEKPGISSLVFIPRQRTGFELVARPKGAMVGDSGRDHLPEPWLSPFRLF